MCEKLKAITTISIQFLFKSLHPESRIRIRIKIKPWIRICIKTYADPKIVEVRGKYPKLDPDL